MAVEGFATRRDVPEPQVRRIYGILLCFLVICCVVFVSTCFDTLGVYGLAICFGGFAKVNLWILNPSWRLLNSFAHRVWIWPSVRVIARVLALYHRHISFIICHDARSSRTRDLLWWICQSEFVTSWILVRHSANLEPIVANLFG